MREVKQVNLEDGDAVILFRENGAWGMTFEYGMDTKHFCDDCEVNLTVSDIENLYNAFAKIMIDSAPSLTEILTRKS